MAKTWHPTIEAHEIYGSRRENWNDKSPSVTLILEIDADDAEQFVEDSVITRPQYPLFSPFKLYLSSAEVIAVASRYTGESTPAGLDEYIAPINPVQVQVTYSNDNRNWFTIYDTETGTGNAQSVLLTELVTIVTETLQLDFRDYVWDDGDDTPLSSSDLAPGKLYRTYKVVQIWERIELTPAIETILFDACGTVNENNVRFLTFTTKTFIPEQVLFAVEDLSPSITAESQLVPSVEVQLYTLRLSYTCRSGESTWNKMWRTKQQSGQDDSGWFRIKHAKTSIFGTTPDAYLFELSAAWDIFVSNPP